MSLASVSPDSATRLDSAIELAIKTELGAPNAPTAFSLDVQLDLPGQGVTAIFGASGSGKTTLLRCLAGLQVIQSGFIRVKGETWHDRNYSLATHQRGVGYVFQEASLLEHLSAGDNLRYAVKRAPKENPVTTQEQISELMGITALLERMPQQLSGGERQRVAIARALLTNPRLLLMDEPLAALDHRRRQEILPYLERLHREISLPILYVTHSLEEVTRLADYLVLLDAGQVLAQGQAMDVLARPELNLGNGVEAGAILSGEIVERDVRWHLARVRFDGGELWVRDRAESARTEAVSDDSVRLRIQARDISLSLEPEQRSSILNRLPAIVGEIVDANDPAMATVQLQIGASTLLARVSRRSIAELGIEQGSQLWAQIKSVAILN